MGEGPVVAAIRCDPSRTTNTLPFCVEASSWVRCASVDRKAAVFSSNSAAERANDNLIDGKRRKRIARGSGTSVQEVNQVLRQYSDMRRMMKQYGSMAKMKMRGLGKLAGMK